MILTVFFLASIAIASQQQHVFEQKATRYDGYKLVQVDQKYASQFDGNPDVDVWSEYPLTAMVSDLGVLKGIEFKLINGNVQDLIDQSEVSNLGGASFHERYHNYEEIKAFMEQYHRAHPQQTELFVIGQTYEGVDIMGIKLKSINEKAQNIIWNGAQHAREWISAATLLWLIDNMAGSMILNNNNVHIIPVVNIDGYQFSHTSNRLQRKNRQPNKGSWCIGTDINRNWNASFYGAGRRDNACGETYRGASPFSAPETKALSNYIASVDNFIQYIDFHAYSQLWMYPYAYNCRVKAKDDADLYRGANVAVQALEKVHGTRFAAGSVCKIIYQAYGGSLDWTYDHAGIKYSYAVELRDRGQHGFLLPPSQIIPSGQEMLAALEALAEVM